MDVSKIGVPHNGWFTMEKPIRMDDLGIPLFLEKPKWDCMAWILNSKVAGLFGMDCRAGGFWCVGRRCLGPKSWHLNWQICNDSGRGCSWHTTRARIFSSKDKEAVTAGRMVGTATRMHKGMTHLISQ